MTQQQPQSQSGATYRTSSSFGGGAGSFGPDAAAADGAGMYPSYHRNSSLLYAGGSGNSSSFLSNDDDDSLIHSGSEQLGYSGGSGDFQGEWGLDCGGLGAPRAYSGSMLNPCASIGGRTDGSFAAEGSGDFSDYFSSGGEGLGTPRSARSMGGRGGSFGCRELGSNEDVSPPRRAQRLSIKAVGAGRPAKGGTARAAGMGLRDKVLGRRAGGNGVSATAEHLQQHRQVRRSRQQQQQQYEQERSKSPELAMGSDEEMTDEQQEGQQQRCQPQHSSDAEAVAAGFRPYHGLAGSSKYSSSSYPSGSSTGAGTAVAKGKHQDVPAAAAAGGARGNHSLQQQQHELDEGEEELVHQLLPRMNRLQSHGSGALLLLPDIAEAVAGPPGVTGVTCNQGSEHTGTSYSRVPQVAFERGGEENAALVDWGVQQQRVEAGLYGGVRGTYSSHGGGRGQQQQEVKQLEGCRDGGLGLAGFDGQGAAAAVVAAAAGRIGSGRENVEELASAIDTLAQYLGSTAGEAGTAAVNRTAVAAIEAAAAATAAGSVYEAAMRPDSSSREGREVQQQALGAGTLAAADGGGGGGGEEQLVKGERAFQKAQNTEHFVDEVRMLVGGRETAAPVAIAAAAVRNDWLGDGHGLSLGPGGPTGTADAADTSVAVDIRQRLCDLLSRYEVARRAEQREEQQLQQQQQLCLDLGERPGAGRQRQQQANGNGVSAGASNSPGLNLTRRSSSAGFAYGHYTGVSAGGTATASGLQYAASGVVNDGAVAAFHNQGTPRQSSHRYSRDSSHCYSLNHGQQRQRSSTGGYNYNLERGGSAYGSSRLPYDLGRNVSQGLEDPTTRETFDSLVEHCYGSVAMVDGHDERGLIRLPSELNPCGSLPVLPEGMYGSGSDLLGAGKADLVESALQLVGGPLHAHRPPVDSSIGGGYSLLCGGGSSRRGSRTTPRRSSLGGYGQEAALAAALSGRRLAGLLGGQLDCEDAVGAEDVNPAMTFDILGREECVVGLHLGRRASSSAGAAGAFEAAAAAGLARGAGGLQLVGLGGLADAGRSDSIPLIQGCTKRSSSMGTAGIMLLNIAQVGSTCVSSWGSGGFG